MYIYIYKGSGLAPSLMPHFQPHLECLKVQVLDFERFAMWYATSEARTV